VKSHISLAATLLLLFFSPGPVIFSNGFENGVP